MTPSDNGIPDSWPPPPPKKPRQGSGSPGIPEIPPFAVPLILLGLIVGGLLFLVLTGRAGIVNIADTEVAVIVNYLTGEEEVIRTPGVAFFVPWLNDAYVMYKSPNEFYLVLKSEIKEMIKDFSGEDLDEPVDLS
ncbi:MAG: hypothetical protein P8K66_11385 [Planctomycetota bacterium]|nr:hypothetical protein [Planctomycetota bacterium]